ncbi:hypothetical protein [Mycobacterium sp. 23]|uniref:hypothetical protein n=1 Tax=Mycobacterium sp. 23 TaxID=3400424 RepID=UPI003AAC2A24
MLATHRRAEAGRALYAFRMRLGLDGFAELLAYAAPTVRDLVNPLFASGMISSARTATQ